MSKIWMRTGVILSAVGILFVLVGFFVHRHGEQGRIESGFYLLEDQAPADALEHFNRGIASADLSRAGIVLVVFAFLVLIMGQSCLWWYVLGRQQRETRSNASGTEEP
jgi:hypothetical protein